MARASLRLSYIYKRHLRFCADVVQSLCEYPSLTSTLHADLDQQDVFRHAGLRPVNYPYAKGVELDFPAFLSTVEAAPDRSVFCLHACAHNPTGIDPLPDQWMQLARVFARKHHFAFWDAAYLGFKCVLTFLSSAIIDFE